MNMTCFIQYEIEPYKLEGSDQYARSWSISDTCQLDVEVGA